MRPNLWVIERFTGRLPKDRAYGRGEEVQPLLVPSRARNRYGAEAHKVTEDTRVLPVHLVMMHKSL